jgi:hypothetical protein
MVSSTSDQFSAYFDSAPDDSSTSESRVDSEAECSAAPESGDASRAAAEEDYDPQRDELGVAPAPNGHGKRRDPVLATETNPVPPGGLTNSTPGQSDRVQQALVRAAAKANTVTNGQAPGAHRAVERDLDESKPEG